MTLLWQRYINPFILRIMLFILAAIIGDVLLHHYNLVWVGRYLGILGTVLVVLSLTYSLRKRKIIQSGNIKSLLSLHEVSAWLGSLFILIHSGIHFNAILPWLATAAMCINVTSGLVGKFLLRHARTFVANQREEYIKEGLTPEEVEQSVYWDMLMVKAMSQWRKIHIPIFILFAVLALAHIISIFIFWGWV